MQQPQLFGGAFICVQSHVMQTLQLHHSAMCCKHPQGTYFPNSQAQVPRNSDWLWVPSVGSYLLKNITSPYHSLCVFCGRHRHNVTLPWQITSRCAEWFFLYLRVVLLKHLPHSSPLPETWLHFYISRIPGRARLPSPPSQRQLLPSGG